MNLKYNTNIEKESINVTFSYDVQLPPFILEILLNAFNNRFKNIENYLFSKFNNKDSSLYKILINAFFKFDDLIKLDLKANKNKIKDIIESKKLDLKEEKLIYITSYSEILESLILKIDKNEILLKNKKEINKYFKNIILKQIDNCSNIQIINSEIKNNEKINEEIKIKLDRRGLTFQEESIKSISNEILIKNNNLLDEFDLKEIDYNNNLLILKNESIEKLRRYDQEIHDKNRKKLKKFQIRENSIEVFNIGSYKNIPVYWKDSVTYSTFIQESHLYKFILSKYLGDEIKINKFICLKFLESEDKVIGKILKDSNIEKYAINKNFLLKLLLNDYVKNIDFNLDIKILNDILIKSSLIQLPLMINKIPLEIKNRLLDIKLINKISNIDIALLSIKQIELFKDEQQKKEAMKNEYTFLIGKIATIGIREKLGMLDKKMKKIFKVNNKDFKKWLNKHIGHNQGKDEETTLEMINKAKNILRKSEKIINHLNKKTN